MQAAIAGNETAYHGLLLELSRWLRTRLRARLLQTGHGDADTEEAVQETLLAIHLKRHTWRRDAPFVPWVAAIARNKLVDQLRRRHRRAEVPLDEMLDDLPDTPQPEQTSATRDIGHLLNLLDERQRAIVLGVAIEGRTAREAAVALGMSEGAVRVTLHRCLQRLARRIREEQT
jgi:RNA polymerase sigma-70 factor (ECF subfamily)